VYFCHAERDVVVVVVATFGLIENTQSSVAGTFCDRCRFLCRLRAHWSCSGAKECHFVECVTLRSLDSLSRITFFTNCLTEELQQMYCTLCLMSDWNLWSKKFLSRPAAP